MKNKNQKLFIKIGFSKRIGTGHFYRSIFLAKELLKKKIQIFICYNKHFNKRQIKIIKENKFIYLSNLKNFNYIKEKIKDLNITNVLIDDPFILFKEQKKYKKIVKKLILYQDIPKKNFCDIIINHNLISNSNHRYRQISEPKTIFLLGLDNFFLKKNQKIIKKKRKVIIFFGGTTNFNIISKTLNVISNDIFNKYTFNVVIGGLTTISKMKKYKKNIKIFKTMNQSEFHKNISESRFIICSGGTTLLEALVLKTFPIVLQTATNQKYNVNYLKNKNFISFLGSKNFTKKSMTNILRNKLLKSKSEKNLILSQNKHKSSVDALSNKVYELLINK